MAIVLNKLIDPENKNAEGECLGFEVRTILRDRGGQWAAYQNHDLGNQQLGHLKFLKYGLGCTHETPPNHYPHDSISQGHNYVLVGTVDTLTSVIKDF